MSLSKALCLPTSSFVATTFPLLSINELACIPPVFENSDCSLTSKLGDFNKISLLIFGKDKFNFSLLKLQEYQERFFHKHHKMNLLKNFFSVSQYLNF